MSLYNATVGTATKLVVTSGNVACKSLYGVELAVDSGINQLERVALSSAISLKIDRDNEAKNSHARQQDAAWILAEREEAHKARLASNPALAAAYNRIMGIAP